MTGPTLVGLILAVFVGCSIGAVAWRDWWRRWQAGAMAAIDAAKERHPSGKAMDEDFALWTDELGEKEWR